MIFHVLCKNAMSLYIFKAEARGAGGLIIVIDPFKEKKGGLLILCWKIFAKSSKKYFYKKSHRTDMRTMAEQRE